MIVSAPYRSGGTSLCIHLAEQHKLRFAGQIDSNTVRETVVENKNLIHEYSNQPWHTIQQINDMLGSYAPDSVILNNSNPALFIHTDVFIIRKRLEYCYFSLVKTLQKQYERIPEGIMLSMFKRLTFFNALLYDYINRHNITPLILEDQPWYDGRDHGVIPERFTSMIAPHTQFVLKQYACRT